MNEAHKHVGTQLGEYHPTTIAITEGLAAALFQAKEFKSAISLLTDLVKLHETNLGPDHEITKATATTLKLWKTTAAVQRLGTFFNPDQDSGAKTKQANESEPSAAGSE